MTITIGNTTFNHATYDERGDVLYLHVGDRQAAADTLGTPEGHAVRYNAGGEVVGLTIINAREAYRLAATRLGHQQRQGQR